MTHFEKLEVLLVIDNFKGPSPGRSRSISVLAGRRYALDVGCRGVFGLLEVLNELQAEGGPAKNGHSFHDQIEGFEALSDAMGTASAEIHFMLERLSNLDAARQRRWTPRSTDLFDLMGKSTYGMTFALFVLQITKSLHEQGARRMTILADTFECVHHGSHLLRQSARAGRATIGRFKEWSCRSSSRLERQKRALCYCPA